MNTETEKDMNEDNSIPVLEMKDGDKATIVSWPYQLYIGDRVVRRGDDLCRPDRNAGFFPGTFKYASMPELCRVRLDPNPDAAVAAYREGLIQRVKEEITALNEVHLTTFREGRLAQCKRFLSLLEQK